MSYDERVEPYRAELHAHCYRMLGSAQDAEDALQEALLRAWRSLERFEGRSSLRTWLYTIATNVCLKAIERPPEARAARSTTAPPADPHDGARRRAPRVGVDRALPRRRAGARRRARRARRPLRAAREHRARVHRRAAAPARPPARGADPARRARLLGARGRRRAGDVAAGDRQRSPAGAQDGRRAAPRPQPAGHAARARGRAAARARRRLRGGVGARRRRRGRGAARRRRRADDAAAPGVVPRPRGGGGVPARLPAVARASRPGSARRAPTASRPWPTTPARPAAGRTSSTPSTC